MTSGRDEYLERTKKHIDYDAENERRNWWLNNTGGDAATNLTVRDYFAVTILNGLLSNNRFSGDMGDFVKDAFDIADLAMKERAK